MSTTQGKLLAAETAYFDANAEQLLLTYPNRFLLIHGAEVIGDFERHAEAVGEGVRRFGRGPFLVRRTGDQGPELTAPALALGILQCRR